MTLPITISRSSPTSSTSSLVTPSTSLTYTRTGIGGAGNYHKAASVPAALPVPQIIVPRYGSFSSGVGGAGNIHSASRRAVLSADEELAREQAIKRNARPAYHVGVGGAGNYVHKSAPPVTLAPIYSTSPLPNNGFDVLWRRISDAFASLSSSISRRSSVDDGSDGKSSRSGSIVSKLSAIQKY
jgi:hypothetical protein